MALPLTTVSMTSSVAFGTYRNCLHCLSQARGAGGGPNTKMEVFLSGLAGGVAQISVMAPGDIVKVRLQCQTESKKGATNTSKPKYQGPVHCLLSILKEDGVRGLYRGALPLMLRDGPSYAVYFLMYRTVSELLTDFGEKKPSWIGVMFGGAVAGMSAWTVGTPMDVVKARLQMDGLLGKKQYRNFFHCLTKTLRTEGVGVFFRTLGLNYVRAVPVSMMVFLTYEVITAFLQTSSDNTDTPPVGFE
ncbi:solute carrier family 25 member 47-A isoform X2 [Takifugu flavidus]|nr:solute carrier family 25 member 47-A isoform X2 [Takifugu flavidus]